MLFWALIWRLTILTKLSHSVKTRVLAKSFNWKQKFSQNRLHTVLKIDLSNNQSSSEFTKYKNSAYIIEKFIKMFSYLSSSCNIGLPHVYTGSEDSENKTASVECECLQAWIQDWIFTEGKFQNELGGKKRSLNLSYL